MAQKKIANNVIDHKLLDNKRVVEDVVSITPPKVEHPTDEIRAAGIPLDLNLPNKAKVNAMELKINHNNGKNCRYLRNPGKHKIEGRMARQNYDVANVDMALDSIKFRATVMHVSTETNQIESGNPYAATETFSVIRWEEELNGEMITKVDVAGTVLINGRDCRRDVESILK